MFEVNSLCETYQIWLFFRFYENCLELFKSGLLFHDLRMTRKACSRQSWKNYTYIYVINRVASQYLFLLIVKGIRFATGFHENWNLELCNLTYKSGYMQIFCLSSKVRVMYIVFFEALNINTPWWHWIVVIAHVVFSAKLRLQCSWKRHPSSFKQQRRHFSHDMLYV